MDVQAEQEGEGGVDGEGSMEACTLPCGIVSGNVRVTQELNQGSVTTSGGWWGGRWEGGSRGGGAICRPVVDLC